MNNWLNQLERKYSRFGIPNLTNILVGGQILVLAIELFVNQTVSVWLALSRYFLLRGQIWRIITFAFIPSYGGSILSAVLGIYSHGSSAQRWNRSGAISAIRCICSPGCWAPCWPACSPA